MPRSLSVRVDFVQKLYQFYESYFPITLKWGHDLMSETHGETPAWACPTIYWRLRPPRQTSRLTITWICAPESPAMTGC